MTDGVKDGIKEKKSQQKVKEQELKDSSKDLVKDVSPIPVLPMDTFVIDLSVETVFSIMRTKDQTEAVCIMQVIQEAADKPADCVYSALEDLKFDFMCPMTDEVKVGKEVVECIPENRPTAAMCDAPETNQDATTKPDDATT